MNGVSIVKTGEAGYTPLSTSDLSEEEAQLLVAQIVKTMKARMATTPIWQQYEFSRRAQNVLERERIVTWPELAIALTGSKSGAINIRGVGANVQCEWAAALAATGWSFAA